MSGRALARRLSGLVILGVVLTGCSSMKPTATTTAPSLRASTPVAPSSSAQPLPPTVAATPAATPPPTPAAPAPPPGVILLTLENNSYASVIGNGDAPALNALAARYGLATQSFATAHPSLPNYLELVAGSTFGIRSDCTTCNVEGTTLADQLVSSGHSWGAYSEDMPQPCWNGAAVDDSYAKKHNPFMYFDHVRADPSLCNQDQPFGGFYPALDAGTLPSFSLVVPNLCDDGHSCSLAHSDAWVRGFSDHVVGSAWFHRGGVLLITYDEGGDSSGCCGGAAGGHVPTWVISASTPAGARLDTAVTHAGVLRTVESLYGLGFLGDATCTCSGSLLPLLGR